MTSCENQQYPGDFLIDTLSTSFFTYLHCHNRQVSMIAFLYGVSFEFLSDTLFLFTCVLKLFYCHIFAQLFINKKNGTCSLRSLVYSLPRFLDARVNKIIIIAARIGQLPIFVLKASENSICREVCLEVCKFVSLFYQFPVPAA